MYVIPETNPNSSCNLHTPGKPSSSPHMHKHTHIYKLSYTHSTLNVRSPVLTRIHKQKTVPEKLARKIIKKMKNTSHEEKFQKSSRQEKQFKLVELKNGIYTEHEAQGMGPALFPFIIPSI